MSLAYPRGVATPEQMAGKTGLEIMQALVRGEFPAAEISGPMRFWLAEAEEGRCVFIGEPDESLRNPQGTIHGGWGLALIDSAAGCAAHTTLPADVGYTTVETHGSFTRPILPDGGPVQAEGRVINRGRTLITAEATLTDSQGRVLAHGGSTLMVLAGR